MPQFNGISCIAPRCARKSADWRKWLRPPSRSDRDCPQCCKQEECRKPHGQSKRRAQRLTRVEPKKGYLFTLKSALLCLAAASQPTTRRKPGRSSWLPQSMNSFIWVSFLSTLCGVVVRGSNRKPTNFEVPSRKTHLAQDCFWSLRLCSTSSAIPATKATPSWQEMSMSVCV